MTPLQQTFTAMVRSVQNPPAEPDRRSTEARRAQGKAMKDERDARKAETLTVVQQNPGCTVETIAEHFGLGKSTVGNYLLELKREGLIVGTRQKRTDRERFYEADR